MTVINLPPLSAPARITLDELIRRHVGMVYAAALRQVRDPHLASDVTQAVFLLLQQKYERFGPGTILAAWLLRATRYTCLTALHQRRRRWHHEHKASEMRQERQIRDPSAAAADDDWSAVIDTAIEELGNADRLAIAAVYFEGLSHGEMGRRMGISEEAAHKRVQRAIERLRKVLGTKGCGVGAITGALATVGRPAAAPAGVTQGVVSCVGGQTPAMVQTIANGAMLMMKVLQVKAAALVMALACGGAVGVWAAAASWASERPPVALESLPQVTVAGAAPAVPATGPAGFAPEVLLTVNDDGAGFNFMADLDSGKFITPPRGLAGPLEGFDWVGENGGDISYENTRDRRAVMGFDLAAVPRINEQYETITASELMSQLLPSTPSTPATLSARALPATFAFRTREGAVGVLQIAENPGGLAAAMIRYRMLTPAARDRAASQMAVRTVLPAIEMHYASVDAALRGDHAEPGTASRSLARGTLALAELARGTPFSIPARRAATAAQAVADESALKNMGEARKALERLEQALKAASVEIQKAATVGEGN